MPEFVINPMTGATITLSDSLGASFGLPRVDQPRMNQAPGQSADPYWNPALDAQAYDDQESRGGALPQFNPDSNTYQEGGRNVFPFGQQSGGTPLTPGHSPIAAPRTDMARIAQATGPVGTVGQIGKQTALDLQPGGVPVAADVGSLSQDLAAATPQPPPDPSHPEEAGAALQRQGLAMEEQSATMAGAADAKAATAEEAALADRAKQAKAVQAETERQQKAWEQRRVEIEGDVTKKTDEWSTYKIDQGRRWRNTGTGAKIGAAISVAMSALGDALMKKAGPNLALDMITKSIEDDVNLQVQERQHLGEVAAKSRSSLDDYRRNFGDWQQARAGKLAEEYKRTADEIERIAAGQKSDLARSRSVGIVGALRERAGALDANIAMAGYNREQAQAAAAEKKRQDDINNSFQRQQMAQSDRHFGAQMAFNEKELAERAKERAATQQAKVDEYLAKASAEDQKALRENGIRDPSTRQYIMGDDGKPILERNATEGGKTQELLGNTQTILSSIDDIKGKIAADPGFQKLNPTQKQAALSTALDSLALQIKKGQELGTLDKGSVDFLNKYTGGDPTKVNAGSLFGALGIGADSGDKTSAKLDEIAKASERNALNRLGNPKGFKFKRIEVTPPSEVDKAAESVQQSGSTVASARAAEEPGWLSKGVQDVSSTVFGTEQQYKKNQRAIDEGGSTLKYPGFSPDRQKDLDTLVAAAGAGDEKAQKRIVEMAGNQKEPGLPAATMTLLDANPELASLIPQAEAVLPADLRATRQALAAARARGAGPQIKLYPGAGVAPTVVPHRAGSILSPQQEAEIAQLPEQYRQVARTALEAKIFGGD